MTSHAGRSAGRRVSNLTTATRESSAQPERRQTFRADLRKPGLLHPPPSAATLPQPAPFGAHRRTPARTFRVRAAAANREYHRAVRAAEMVAWNAASPSDTTLFRAAVAAAQFSRTEKLAFNVIFILALVGIVWGLADSVRFVDGWQQFVALVRHLIG